MSFGENLADLVAKSTNELHGKHTSWERVRLEDVAHLVNGFAFRSSAFNESEGTPIVRIRDVTSGSAGTLYRGPTDDPRMTFIEDGQIAIGMDGNFNSRLWSGGRALLNQRVCTVQADEEFYSQRLLSYALPGYLRLINEHTSAVTVKHLSSFTVRDIPLPLPPINEQRRIVEKIDTLFAELDKGEESLRQVQTLLARYRQSVLKAAVTEFTGSSETVRLGELLEDIRYGTAKKCRAEVEGVPVLRIPNVVTGQIELEDLKFAELEEKELSRLSLTRGDVLLVRSNGSANLVGRTAVVDDRAAGMAFAGYLIRLRVDRNRILPEFLHIVLNSPEVREKIERQARSTSGVHNINSTEVRAIEFELPTVATQSEIVEQLGEQVANADLLEAACIAELSRSAALRQSILKDAFSGRLVPQDPHDEPASELLARIHRSQEAGRAAKR
ncbi:restriction endonuclease subunit S [Luteimonas qiangzhengi]|uniref:restriction endonuclease subunit S n=1 Tax=Luteimonas sp. MJ146 TaxID=3129240 RepID=UPI0031BBA64C